VAASNTNLGSIGYHFGTKDALMNAALIQATEDWGTELGEALAANIDLEATPLQRFESTWTRVIANFEAHRQLWVAQFEIFSHLQHAPEMRPYFSAAQETARRGLATLLQLIDPNSDEKSVRSVGSFALAMLTGVIAQWLVDPDKAPNGKDLADAIRAVAGVEAVLP